MVNYMEDMNVHEVVYNDKVFIIKVIGKLSKTKLTILNVIMNISCLLYTSPSPRDRILSRMPSSA